MLQNGIQERDDGQSLCYILTPPQKVFATGYKVLKSQEKAGFIQCALVYFNGKEKLVYNVEKYTPLSIMLPTLRPENFLSILSAIFEVVGETRNIGFIQCGNIQIEFNRIYLDPSTYRLHLVYLPLENTAGADNFAVFCRQLYHNIVAAAQSCPSLQSEAVQKFCALLQNPAASFEQHQLALREILAPFTTGSLQKGQTTTMEPEVAAPPSPPVLTAQDGGGRAAAGGEEKKTGIFSKIFGQKEKSEKPARPVAALVVEDEGGATDVLDDIFVPTLVFVGLKTPEKIEYLISKQEFILGKKPEIVDGALAFNTAISRQHCKIVFSNGKNFLVDMRSANGTFLNGKRLMPNRQEEVRPGDKIKLANSNFVVKSV